MAHSWRSAARLVGRLVFRLVAGLYVLSTAAFFLIQLMPGDPALRVLGGIATNADIARTRQALGLNDPLAVRYLHFLKNLFTLNLGDSFTGDSILSILGARAANTAELASCSVIVTAILAVTVGLLMAAATQNERRAKAAFAFTTSGGLIAAIPGYVLAMGLVALFSVQLGWFPVAGADQLSSFVLPVLALAIPAAAVLARIVRVEALNALQSDYARTARSKRISSWRLYVHHILPNVLTGALTIGGVMFGYLLGGSVIVENVFQWPGLGTALVDAVNKRDYPVLQYSIVFIGAGVLLINALVDVALFTLDPRLRST